MVLVSSEELEPKFGEGWDLSVRDEVNDKYLSRRMEEEDITGWMERLLGWGEV